MLGDEGSSIESHVYANTKFRVRHTKSEIHGDRLLLLHSSSCGKGSATNVDRTIFRTISIPSYRLPEVPGNA